MRVLKWSVIVILTLAVSLWALGQWTFSRLQADQPQMFAEPVFDVELPGEFAVPNTDGTRPMILVFSKTNGFRHHEAIAAARKMFEALALSNDWDVHFSENGAVFTPAILQRFAVVVWSNATGPALNSSQQQAFKEYLINGGGFVGIHAAGDASHAAWPWYQQQVIRADFTGHPVLPQFQTGTVITEDRRHPAMAHMPQQWQHEEEWYCFAASPRDRVDVLARLDEEGINMFTLASRDSLALGDLAMGADHPIIWSHKLGTGRVFYSALGHRAEVYSDVRLQTMMEQAVVWAGQLAQ